MKKKLIQMSLVSAAVVFALMACNKEEIDPQSSDAGNLQKSGMTGEIVPDKVKEKLATMAINPHDVVSYNVIDPDGSVCEGYLAHDIFIAKKNIWNMDSYSSANNEAKLFRTANIVSTPNTGQRTIEIRAYTGATFGGNTGGLNTAERNALNWAVNRYNNLNLRIRFNVTFTTNASTLTNGDMYVVRNTNNGNDGGFAEFPALGDPGFRFVIDQFTRNNGTNALRQVCVHELGHTIGLIHADYRTRASCGVPSAGETDAYAVNGFPSEVHIAGTDQSGNYQVSVMKACYVIGSTLNQDKGVFTSEDINALNILY